VAYWLRLCATRRTVPGWNSDGVTGDFFHGSPRQNHTRLRLWKWVSRISPGVKSAGAYGWQPTTLRVPNVKKIWSLNLPGTPWVTSACCGMTFTFTFTTPAPLYLYLHYILYYIYFLFAQRLIYINCKAEDKFRGYMMLPTVHLCGRNVFGGEIYIQIKPKLYMLQTAVCLPQQGFKKRKLMKNELQLRN